jgi:hypothetical protein
LSQRQSVWNQIVSFVNEDPEELVRKVLAANKNLGEEMSKLGVEEARLLADARSIEEEVSQVWDEQKSNGWPISFVTPRLNELNRRNDGIATAIGAIRARRGIIVMAQERSAEDRARIAAWREELPNPTREFMRELVERLVFDAKVVTTEVNRRKQASLTYKLRWRPGAKNLHRIFSEAV